MENEQDLGYFARFVAEKLGVSRDTLRAWSLKLENHGIQFERNKRGDRIYYQKDINALVEMHELLGLQQSMESVLNIVAEKMKKGDYIKVERENNGEKTLSVIDSENEQLTDEKRLIEFKSEIIRELRGTIREEFKESMKQAVKEAIAEERGAMAAEITNSVMLQLNNQQLALPEVESERDQERKQIAEQVASDLLEEIEQKRTQNEEEVVKGGFLSRLFNKKTKKHG